MAQRPPSEGKDSVLKKQSWLLPSAIRPVPVVVSEVEGTCKPVNLYAMRLIISVSRVTKLGWKVELAAMVISNVPVSPISVAYRLSANYTHP